MPFIANSDADRREMLEAVGVKSVEDLFSDIPEARRFPRLDLPKGLSELEVLREIEVLSSKNLSSSCSAWFLGAGAYNHFIPALVPSIAGRGEFLTAYTPYQPEVSQGTLQAIFEYQSMAAELFGMDVVNASHYDGATALAEAVLMAWKSFAGRDTVLISSDLHPEYKQVLATYFAAFPVRFVEYGGEPAQAPLDSGVCALVASYPGFSGRIPDMAGAAEAVHAAGALFIVQADPVMCGILKSPGSLGADLVTAEGQSLGNAMNYGGPFLGMMGATTKLMRKMPGRIVGEAKDHSGRRGFVLTLTAREQHIRREKAVSNICSNQGLVMLQTCIYLAAMGKTGLAAAARLCWNKAHYAAALIGAIPGFEVEAGSFFKEFTVKTPKPAADIAEKLTQKGIVPGLPLSRYYPERDHELVVCVTEMNTRAEIELLRGRPQGGSTMNLVPEALVYELSSPGRVACSMPACDVPETPVPAALARDSLNLPELDELSVVRHFTRLSQKNYSIDTQFYPLGSCTMKYNPKANEYAASLPGWKHIHPLAAESSCQGAIELIYRLQNDLAEIGGFAAVSLQPAAGAHGELAGVFIIRAWHLARGDTKRTTILIPDSAHGTNPASCTMAGLVAKTIPSNAEGEVDLDALVAALDDTVAGIMITNPNTLGIFDRNIEKIAGLVHAAGGLVYGDGANMNALTGIFKPGEAGIDVMHFNLHKTFSTPHGGGGPGAGMVGVRADLAKFLPGPIAARRADGAYTMVMPEAGIGRMKAFYGNFGVLVRAYVYIRMLGSDGLRRLAENAVLNANYIKAKLNGIYPEPYRRRCMHEFVTTGNLAEGVHTLDIAKRLIDFGFHPPTIYFPLIVAEAIMIEPTETESKATLDAFIDAMKSIAAEAVSNPALLHDAPTSTPVGPPGRGRRRAQSCALLPGLGLAC